MKASTATTYNTRRQAGSATCSTGSRGTAITEATWPGQRAALLRLGRVSALLCEAEFRKNRGKRRAGTTRCCTPLPS
jgi:hypothetical protein